MRSSWETLVVYWEISIRCCIFCTCCIKKVKYLNLYVQWTQWHMLREEVGNRRAPTLARHGSGSGSPAESPPCWSPGQGSGQDLAMVQGQSRWLPGCFSPREGEGRQLCGQKWTHLFFLGAKPRTRFSFVCQKLSARRAQCCPPTALLSCPGWKPSSCHPA